VHVTKVDHPGIRLIHSSQDQQHETRHFRTGSVEQPCRTITLLLRFVPTRTTRPRAVFCPVDVDDHVQVWLLGGSRSRDRLDPGEAGVEEGRTVNIN